MEKYILVKYKIEEQLGKIMISDKLSDKEIKQICFLDSLNKTDLIQKIDKVEILKESEIFYENV